MLSAPSVAPDSVLADSYSPSTLEIEWAGIPEKSFNGRPLGYNISYFPDGLESDLSFATIAYDFQSYYYHFLSGLAFNTTYVIRVSAVSGGGIGPGVDTIVTTGKVMHQSVPYPPGTTPGH